MSTPQSYAALEIGLSSGGQPGRYRVQARFEDPGDAAARPPVSGEALVDFDELFGLELDPEAYGRALASSLFAAEDVARLVDRAKVAVGGGGQFLRVKLFVDRSAPELDQVRWELLTDPSTGDPLATSERILFSRFGTSDDWRTVALRPRGELRALVAVSNPSDLAGQGLAEVDVEGEVARAREQLSVIAVEVAGRDEPLTVARLVDGLRGGVDILYLVCHGALVAGRGSVLWLQKETGEIDPTGGEELARRIGELARPPRLVVLASCESAGSESVSTQDGVIAGQLVPLAPLLAEAGVHAVVAMQGKISMDTVKAAMPVFFSELLRDGQIDRAMAVARGGVRERGDSWMPALFLRLKEGRLWEDTPERAKPPYLETLREFGWTLHQRMPQLLGREQELADIASFATGPPGYRWLVGRAYTGKTALVFEAVVDGLPAEVDVVTYLLSRRASDADSSRFLGAVVPQLAYLCGVDAPSLPDRDQFHALWQRATGRAAESGRQLLLVVDGLDEDLQPAGSPSVASLLPARVDAGAHVLVASRPYPELPPDVADGHPLRATKPVELEPFEGAQELAALARQEIDTLTRGDDLELGLDVLGLLTAAAGPLSVRDLAELSNGTHRRRVELFVSERAARVLEPVGSEENRRYQFAHDSLLAHARQSEDLADPVFRNRIDGWADLWRDRGWPATTDVTTTTPRYLLDSYPATLSGEPERLAALVTDAGWVDAAIQSVGVDRVLADLSVARAAGRSEAEVGAMLAAVRVQAHELSPSHPLAQPGYVSRQLCMQAAEHAENRLADEFRSRLRSLSDPGPVPLWTTRRVSRALLRVLGRHEDGVAAVAVLADSRVVTGGVDGRVLVWDPAEPGSPVELGSHDDGVRAVAVLADGQVISGGDGRVLLWDPAEPGSPVELGSHDNGLLAVAVLPDGRVVSGGRDGRVLLWDPAELGSPVELGSHEFPVDAVAVLPDGRVLSGDVEGRVLLWDPAERGSSLELGCHDGGVAAVAVLPDGRVVSGGFDVRVLVWDLGEPGSPVELGSHYSPVDAVAVLADGRVVSGARESRVLLWDPAEPGSPVELGRHDDEVTAVAVLPDGRVVSGGGGGWVLLWDPAEPGSRPGEFGSHHGVVDAVAVLADGRVISGDDAGRVLVWDPAEPNSRVELGSHSGLRGVAVLPHGPVVSGGRDGRVLLWDPSEPGSPVELGSHDSGVATVAVLPDGQVVSGDWEGRVLLWDPAEPGSRVELGRHSGVVAVAVLADGRVVSGDVLGQLRLWDPAAPGSRVELGSHDDVVRAVAVLPDGRVVSGGREGRVLLWDPDEPGSPVELGRHDGPVSAMAVLPDGRAVSAGRDGRVLLWDVTTQARLAQLSCSATALAVGPSGRGEATLAIAHEGSGLSFWSIAARQTA